MPHTFTAHPDHPAVAYLARLHADLGGKIQANKAEAAKLATDMRAVEAVLKMFDPGGVCAIIPQISPPRTGTNRRARSCLP